MPYLNYNRGQIAAKSLQFVTNSRLDILQLISGGTFEKERKQYFAQHSMFLERFPQMSASPDTPQGKRMAQCQFDMHWLLFWELRDLNERMW